MKEPDFAVAHQPRNAALVDELLTSKELAGRLKKDITYTLRQALDWLAKERPSAGEAVTPTKNQSSPCGVLEAKQG